LRGAADFFRAARRGLAGRFLGLGVTFRFFATRQSSVISHHALGEA
jgi:hypothetical protein